MVSLNIVKEANASLKTSLPAGQVALLVGGTSGIGAAIAKELARDLVAPKLYLLGRNEKAAAQIIEELKTINDGGKYEFIQADVSLLKNVRKATTEFAKRESKLNLLVLSTGVLDLGGRKETSEGIDFKMAINYYSRTLFISDLLPLLRAASTPTGFARVLTVLGAGQESKINESDLSLSDPANYSFTNVLSHTGVMTDFAIEKFAEEPDNKTVAFVHTYPGLVTTGILDNMPLPIRMLKNILTPLLNLFIAVPIEESGARNVYHLTSPRYSAASAAAASASKDEIAKGSNGEVGSGAYFVDWNGEIVGVEKILNDYRERQVKEKIWEDIFSVHKKALNA